jgi:RNA polymerase-binding transcription factor DksA
MPLSRLERTLSRVEYCKFGVCNNRLANAIQADLRDVIPHVIYCCYCWLPPRTPFMQAKYL